MEDVLLLVLVFLATFLAGIVLISRIPSRLHTPLMSMTNAVSGITVLGALLLFVGEVRGLALALSLLAIASGTFNLVGGFAVTDRMLRFFRKREGPE